MPNVTNKAASTFRIRQWRLTCLKKTEFHLTKRENSVIKKKKSKLNYDHLYFGEVVSSLFIYEFLSNDIYSCTAALILH